MEQNNLNLDKAQRGRLTAGILALIAVYGFANNFQSVAINRVVESFQLTGGRQGIMSSMINVGCMVAMLTAPLFQGRVRKAVLLLGAAVLQALAFLGLGAFSAYGAMVGISVVLGIGFGMMDTCCNSAMVDAHPENSSFYLGLLHGGFGVGSLISPLFVSALLISMRWQQVSLLMGGVCFLAGAIYLLLAPSSLKNDISSRREQRISMRDVGKFLMDRQNLLLLCAGVFYAATQSALTVWVVRYMTLRFSNEALGATALSAYWICATVSRFFAPRIPLRPLKLFLLGALLSCGFQAVGVLSGNPPVMCAMTGLIGLVSGQCIPMLLGECTQKYRGMTALPTSVMLFSMCIARILVPLLMGSVADGFSISVAMLLPVLTGLVAAGAGAYALKDHEPIEI